MTSMGTLSSIKDTTKILETIGKNIVVADKDYNIVWMNSKAVDFFSKIITYFNIEDIDDVIGTNMDRFHQNPDYQREIMDKLYNSYSSRINIKDEYVADIIINPIRDSNTIVGYVVMLMDITTVVEEEKRKDKIIQELSGPTLHVWDNTLAIPLLGIVDQNRFNIILKKLLKQCEQEGTEYVIIDFSGIKEWDAELPFQINKMISSLIVMGTQCLIVGIKPKLAQELASENIIKNIPKFGTSKEAIKYIISQY